MKNTLTIKIRYPFQAKTETVELNILQETESMFITEELFSFGIQDISSKYRKKKVVRWDKESGARKGSTPCYYTTEFTLVENKDH